MGTSIYYELFGVLWKLDTIAGFTWLWTADKEGNGFPWQTETCFVRFLRPIEFR